MWAFYPPVICYVPVSRTEASKLDSLHGCQPAMPASGFIGESKLDILRGFPVHQRLRRRSSLIDASLDVGTRIDFAERFMAWERTLLSGGPET